MKSVAVRMSQVFALVGAVACLPITTAERAHAGEWYLSLHGALSDTDAEAFNDGTNGAGNPKSEIDSATRYGISFGNELAPGFRLELEYSIASYETDPGLNPGTGIRAADSFGITSDLDVDLLTLNASYEFNRDGSLSPFIKAGVGTTFYDMNADLFVSSFAGNDFGGALPTTFSYQGSGEEFAYIVAVGLGYQMTDSAALLLEVRHADLGRVTTAYDANGDRIQTELDTQDVQLGVRFGF